MIYDNQDFKEEIRYGKTADYTLYGIIPAGYWLDHVLIENITSNVGQLSLGSTASLGDYFSGQAINPSGQTLINVKKIPISKSDTSLYLNTSQEGDTWNSMTINIKLYFRRGIL